MPKSKTNVPLAEIAVITSVLLIGLMISAWMLDRYLNLPGLIGPVASIGMGLAAAGVGSVLAWRLSSRRLAQLLGVITAIAIILAVFAPQPRVQTGMTLSWNRRLWSSMVIPVILCFATWCGVSLTWLLLRGKGAGSAKRDDVKSDVENDIRSPDYLFKRE